MTQEWTNEEIKKLINLRKAGKSWYEIANILGRTKEASRRKYRDLAKKNPDKFNVEIRKLNQMYDRHGRKITFWTKDMIKTLIKMKMSGFTWKQIAQKLNITPKAAEDKYRYILNSKLKDTILYINEILNNSDVNKNENNNNFNDLVEAYRYVVSTLINKPYENFLSNIVAAENYFLKTKNKNGFVELIKTIKNSKDIY